MIRPRRTDVLIVGAGPAGSALAWHLARSGARALLLDAREFPRSKPCGDAVSPGATPLLREMGVAAALESAGAARIRGWRIRSPDGTWFTGTYRDRDSGAPTSGLCAPREELDSLLLDAAIRAGAGFLPGRRVFDLLRESLARGNGRGRRTVGVLARGPDGREERYGARLVVGADGLRSRVARLLGGVRRGRRRRLAIVGRFRDGPAHDGFGELRLSAEGVLGFAPLGSGRFNLTVVVPADRAPEISADPAAFYRGRLAAYGVVDRLAGARRTGDLEVTGPFEVSPRRRTAPGVLLAGDAVGYFDPFTGQGIYRALVMAPQAAARILRILEKPAREARELRAYEVAVDRLLVPGRRVQRLVDAAIGRPLIMNPAARLLAARPALASLLVDVTGDRLPAGALLSPARLLRSER